MKKIIILILMIFPLSGFAQTVAGTVYGDDEGGKKPLPGVNIYWEGGTDGTASDSNGKFKIGKKNGQHMLVFSFVGYNPKVIHVADAKPLEVVLEPNLELGEVTVVQKNKGTYLSVINPVQTENISGAELIKAACCNLSESFETNPSVDVSYSDAVTGAKQIRLLGLDGIYSLLQTENMPDLRGLATNFGLTYIPGPWMEAIQVSKGAASVQNGYESIAGQINVDYKKPDALEKLHLNLFSSADGKLEFNGNMNMKPVSDKLTTGFFVHAENMSKINDHNHDGFLDDPLARQVNLFNRWKFNNKKGYMAQAGLSYLYENRLGGQTAFGWNTDPVSSGLYGINIETNRFCGFFKTGYVFSNQRTAIAFLSNFARHNTRSFYGLTPYNADETRFYANSVLTTDFDKDGKHTLNAGMSFVFDKFGETLYNSDLGRTESVPGIFAEYTYKPGPDLTAMIGLRSDFHNHFGAFFTPRMHLKYSPSDFLTIRVSAGKGYRTANPVSENIYLLANARPLSWNSGIYQEEAWNYGISLVQTYTVWGKQLQLNTEYFRTDFIHQLVADRETSSTAIILSPLDGKSYANSFQADLRYEPVKNLDLLLAYRINDVKQTIGGRLLEAPLKSRYKGLANLNYTPNLKKWMFDFTAQFNGGGRLPSIPGSTNSTDRFSPYTLMNAQVTKFFRHWNIYLGSENIGNFKQQHPVAGADNPFGPEFDATNVWGPVLGRRVYLGIRFTLNN